MAIGYFDLEIRRDRDLIMLALKTKQNIHDYIETQFMEFDFFLHQGRHYFQGVMNNYNLNDVEKINILKEIIKDNPQAAK